MDTDQSITMSHINARMRSCIATMEANDPVRQSLIGIVDDIDEMIGLEEREIWQRILNKRGEDT